MTSGDIQPGLLQHPPGPTHTTRLVFLSLSKGSEPQDGGSWAGHSGIPTVPDTVPHTREKIPRPIGLKIDGLPHL